MTIQASSGNIYEDLENPHPQEMLLKADLARYIASTIQEKGWTQQYAAQIVGISQPRLSEILNGKFRGISEAKLLECLARLGRDVQIVISPVLRETGRVQVVYA